MVIDLDLDNALTSAADTFNAYNRSNSYAQLRQYVKYLSLEVSRCLCSLKRHQLLEKPR